MPFLDLKEAGKTNKKSPSHYFETNIHLPIVRGTTQIAHKCLSVSSNKPSAVTPQFAGNYYSAQSLSVPDSEVIAYSSDVSASTGADSLEHHIEVYTSSSQSFYLILLV